MILIMSYRKEWRGWDEDDRREECGSDLSLHAAPSPESAAKWLTGRIQEYPRTDYIHLVAANFGDVLAFAEVGLCPSEGEVSIATGGIFGTGVLADEEELLHTDLVEQIKQLVGDALGEESYAHKRRVEDEKRRLKEEAERKRAAKEHAEWLAGAEKRRLEAEKLRAETEAKERTELERLRKKYG